MQAAFVFKSCYDAIFVAESSIMSLKTQLTEDMKTAMRSKNTLALSTIRLANAAIKQFEVDERVEADDAKVQAIISKMIKQRKDSAAIYLQANRQDLADQENAEIAVLQHYLPSMMSADEIAQAVQAALVATGATGMSDMGKVMGILKTQLAGKADMGEVNRILKSSLQSK